MAETKTETVEEQTEVTEAKDNKPEAQVAEENKPVMDGKMGEFIDWIEGISVLELSQLVKALEERLGVSAAAPVAVAVGLAGGEAAAETKADEQTEFTVMLTAFGQEKIKVIKEVRSMTGLGLKDSKDLVEGAPKSVKDGVTKEEAEEMKGKLEAVGASVEIK